MVFDDIEPLLDAKELKLPDLEALRPNATAYKTAIFQPQGKIEAQKGDSPFVRNLEPEIISKKFKLFFKKANDSHCALAVAPEYSMPWLCLENLLAEAIVPLENSIWVVGCESITPKTLLDFTMHKPEVIWIFEQGVDWRRTDRYLDVVCHLFNCPNKNTDGNKLVAVLQFKTEQMGGDSFEHEALLEGNKGYVIKNNGNSIRLATIICSDALKFSFTQLCSDADQLSFLLLHLQLTEDSRTRTFTDYRHTLFSTVLNEECKKEILCVNWAKDTQVVGKNFPIGGSAYYGKYVRSIGNTDIINANEKLGAYYTFLQKSKTSAYYFSYNEHIFIWENDKIYQSDGVAQNHFRNGIKMRKLYKWEIENDIWIESPMFECGLESFCRREINDIEVLNLFSSIAEPVNKERFLVISVGDIIDDSKKIWYSPDNHKYFQINFEEVIYRSTFDFEYDGVAKNQKHHRLSLVRDLQKGIQNGGTFNFPSNISDLKGSCKLEYSPISGSQSSYYYNLYHSSAGYPSAIVCYIGPSTAGKAREVHSNIHTSLRRKLLEEHSIILSSDEQIIAGNQIYCRIVVWYLEGNKFLFENGPIPKITDKGIVSTTSFYRTEKI